MTRTRGDAALGHAALGLAVLLAGCGLVGAEPGTVPPSSAVGEPAAPEPPDPEPTTASQVRAQGTPDVRLAGVTVHLPDDGVREVVRASDADGERWTLTPSGDRTDRLLLLLAAPEGADLRLHDDGSVLLVPLEPAAPDGLGLAPLTTGTLELLAPDLLAVRADPAAPDAAVDLRFGRTAVASATWGEAEGGRSLAVVPTAWARAAGEAGTELVWRHVQAVAGDEATPGMHDQLVCHGLGAPDKASWNLEPWRPDVGLAATLLALCNP